MNWSGTVRIRLRTLSRSKSLGYNLIQLLCSQGSARFLDRQLQTCVGRKTKKKRNTRMRIAMPSATIQCIPTCLVPVRFWTKGTTPLLHRHGRKSLSKVHSFRSRTNAPPAKSITPKHIRTLTHAQTHTRTRTGAHILRSWRIYRAIYMGIYIVRNDLLRRLYANMPG